MSEGDPPKPPIFVGVFAPYDTNKKCSLMTLQKIILLSNIKSINHELMHLFITKKNSIASPHHGVPTNAPKFLEHHRSYRDFRDNGKIKLTNETTWNLSNMIGNMAPRSAIMPGSQKSLKSPESQPCLKIKNHAKKYSWTKKSASEHCTYIETFLVS